MKSRHHLNYMLRHHIETILRNYIPEPAVPLIAEWIQQHDVHLHITERRKTKLGDYRSPMPGNRHKITVNHDLNTYDFLITLIHEFAHLTTWNKHRHKVAPHGEEWKEEYKQLIKPFMQLPVFPEEVKVALRKHFVNPSASCSDVHLQRVLRQYDKRKDDSITTVERIPAGALFKLRGDHVFRKGKLRRTRYECVSTQDGRTYLVSAIAECKKVEEP